jgi:hypothetical protein
MTFTPKTSVKLFSALALICLFLATSMGCTAKDPAYSGFLKDYSKLSADTMGDKGATYWQAPGVSLKTYRKFIVDPVSLHMAPESREETLKVNSAVANNLTAYLHKQLVAELSKKYEIVDRAGADVARIRGAITSIDVKRKDMKVYNFIPAGLVLTGVGEATGIRDSIGVLSMEGEITDSLTGKPVAQVVQAQGVEVDVKKEEDYTEKHAYPTLDFWAQKLRLRISQK